MTMAEEKIFTINLRREFRKKPHYQRSKKAVTAVKEFISQHLKVEEVKIGPHLNLKIWKKGRKNPPPKIKVKANVEDKIAYVELPEFKFEKFKPKEEEEKKVTPKEEKKKEQEKELLKELKKEVHKPEIISRPEKEIKVQEKVKESMEREIRVIGRTGIKGAKDPKP